MVDDNCHRIVFLDILNDWKGLDLDNTTKFDLGMASGYALIAASTMRRREAKLSKVKRVASTSFARKFKFKSQYGIKRSASKFSQSLR
jgi:hypothetical protein